MGNEIAKKYAMQEEVFATGGHACLWRIYSATNKETGEQVSVFVFRKEEQMRDLEKALREQVLQILRREIQTLKLFKHPGVLRLVEIFEETKTMLSFVTERVTGSLASITGDAPPPQRQTAARSRPPGGGAGGGLAATGASADFGTALGPGTELEPFEVARGIYGLAEAVQYVHTIGRRLHLNLAPESIFLAPSGQWKLGGFGFSLALPADGGASTPCPYFQGGARGGFEPPWRLHPSLPFASPEATAPPGSSVLTVKSDLFSLGALMHQLFRRPPTQRLVQLRGGVDSTPLAHQSFCGSLHLHLDLGPLPPEAQQLCASLLAATPGQRPDASTIAANPLFHRTETAALRTFDSLSDRNTAEAATFLSGVRPLVGTFPTRVQRDSVLHPVLEAAARDMSGRLWPFVLPLASDVCGRLDAKDIVPDVQAKLVPGLERPEPETMAAQLELTPLYLGRCERGFVRTCVVPMVGRALQCEAAPRVQEEALKCVAEPTFSEAVGATLLEQHILPRVCWLVVKSAQLSNRVNALLCLAKTFHNYSTNAIVDKVLPTLKFCTERDQSVAVQLCILGVYDAVSKKLERPEPIARSILPSVVAMLAHPELSSKQFEMVASKVQSMLEIVLEKRRARLAGGGGGGGSGGAGTGAGVESPAAVGACGAGFGGAVGGGYGTGGGGGTAGQRRSGGTAGDGGTAAETAASAAKSVIDMASSLGAYNPFAKAKSGSGGSGSSGGYGTGGGAPAAAAYSAPALRPAGPASAGSSTLRNPFAPAPAAAQPLRPVQQPSAIVPTLLRPPNPPSRDFGGGDMFAGLSLSSASSGGMSNGSGAKIGSGGSGGGGSGSFDAFSGLSGGGIRSGGTAGGGSGSATSGGLMMAGSSGGAWGSNGGDGGASMPGTYGGGGFGQPQGGGAGGVDDIAAQLARTQAEIARLQGQMGSPGMSGGGIGAGVGGAGAAWDNGAGAGGSVAGRGSNGAQFGGGLGSGGAPAAAAPQTDDPFAFLQTPNAAPAGGGSSYDFLSL